MRITSGTAGAGQKKTPVVLSILAVTGLLLFLSGGCHDDNLEDISKSYLNENDTTKLIEECDTLEMSYISDIEPIISNHCISCHGDFNVSTVYLRTYEEVRKASVSGRLIGSITHSENFSEMPNGADKLPECKINKIKAWVNQGTPE